MFGKIGKCFCSHPIICIVIGVVVLSVYAVLISMMPDIAVYTISILLLLAMVAIMIVVFYKDAKATKKMQSMGKEDYEKVWKKYVDLVEKTCEELNYDRNKLNSDWIEKFNYLIYEIAVNTTVLYRKFNDFDIAACLIYSLTWDDKDNQNVIFSLECVRQLLNSPNIYIRHLGYGNELELEVESSLEEVNFEFYDEKITSDVLLSIIELYLNEKTINQLVRLSDFLYILYLKCR